MKQKKKKHHTHTHLSVTSIQPRDGLRPLTHTFDDETSHYEGRPSHTPASQNEVTLPN